MNPSRLFHHPRVRLILLLLAGTLAWGTLHSSQTERPEREPTRVAACLVSDTGSHPIEVELARTPAQRQFGLMERSSLPEDTGMLFIYQEERPPSHSFWMYNTLIPLDIAFMGEDGEIRAIQSMAPCHSSGTDCPSYPAGVPFSLALEMNLGYFQRHNIGVGDRLLMNPPSPCP